MKMKRKTNREGKITITTIIVMIVLFYAGFAAFKIITSSVTKSQIKNEIVEKFGFHRGAQFTADQGQEIIEEILEANGVLTPGDDPPREESGEDEYKGEAAYQGGAEEFREGTKIFVEVRERGSKVWFQVEYTDTIDLIFFKKKTRYSIEEEVINYN